MLDVVHGKELFEKAYQWVIDNQDVKDKPIDRWDADDWDEMSDISIDSVYHVEQDLKDLLAYALDEGPWFNATMYDNLGEMMYRKFGKRMWHDVHVADMDEHVHRAYFDANERWNGFVRPWFTKSEAESMNEWLSVFDDSLVYDDETDSFVTTYDPDAQEVFKGTDIDGMHLYPIGNGSWTWLLSEEE